MKFSPLYRKRATDARADYAELSTKRRSAQAALIGVHTKLQAAAKGATGAGASADGARTNPFVGIEKVPEGPPLQLGPAEAAGTAERPGTCAAWREAGSVHSSDGTWIHLLHLFMLGAIREALGR